ncbi:MAG: GNAT family N-acetyltransferase [Pirellulales bacterium]
MSLRYFKRYRMEIDLAGRDFSPPIPPRNYVILPWSETLLEAHAEAKWLSFREEIDASVFPCFADLAGCQRLMQEISRKEGFLREATWLAAYQPNGDRHLEHCGTIQGIRDRSGMGAVQNLGITPAHRNRGLGTQLLLRALEGFQHAGLRHVFLEVTAENQGAIRLYRRVGFAKVRTVYKVVEEASHA